MTPPPQAGTYPPHATPAARAVATASAAMSANPKQAAEIDVEAANSKMLDPRRGSHGPGKRAHASLALLGVAAIGLYAWAVSLQVKLDGVQGDLDDLKKQLKGPLDDAALPEPVAHGHGGAGGVAITTSPKQASLGHLFAGSGYWAERRDMDSPRSDFQAVGLDALNGMILLAGGLDSTSTVLKAATLYDPVLDSFTAVDDMPEPRFRFGMAAAGGKVVVVGGFDSDGDGAQPKKESLVWDVATKKWSVGPSTLEMHGDTCAGAIGSKVYVVAGYGENYSYTRSVEVLDTSAADPRWVQTTPLPAPRGDLTCAVAGGKLYVAGGFYDPSGTWNPNSFHDTLFEFDPATEAWTEKARMGQARGDASMVATAEGNLLIVGGEYHARSQVIQIPVHDVELYNVAHDHWVTKAPMPLARFRFATAMYAGEVFAFGGHVLCSTGWFNDWANLDCPNRALSRVEAFLDMDHPDLFLHRYAGQH